MGITLIEQRGELLQRMETELHDLCQPLTTLQCRLELAAMCGDEATLMEAVKGGLEETERLFVGIGTMREQLRCAMERAQDGEHAEE